MDKWDGAAFTDALKLSADKCVLEIGVGTGRLAIKVAPLCKSFTGIDFSPKTAQCAKQNLSEFKNAKILCADFFEYDFGQRFDVIYSSLTFMHFKDKKAAVNKINQLLNTRGIVVLSLDKSQKQFLDMGTRKIKIYPDSPQNISALLRDTGLKITLETQTEHAFIIAAVRQP